MGSGDRSLYLGLRKRSLFDKLILTVNFSLIMSDVIAKVLSYLFTRKAINEVFTNRKNYLYRTHRKAKRSSLYQQNPID